VRDFMQRAFPRGATRAGHGVVTFGLAGFLSGRIHYAWVGWYPVLLTAKGKVCPRAASVCVIQKSTILAPSPFCFPAFILSCCYYAFQMLQSQQSTASQQSF
jgi:hypothetical protein